MKDLEMLENQTQKVLDDAIDEKEMVYQKSKQIIKTLGYNTIQETIADMLVEGEYNKGEKTWTEITDPSDIMTTRTHMNLAQAKFYGIKIIRADDEKNK